MTKQILIAVLVFVLVGCDEGIEYANQSVEFLVNEQLYATVRSEWYRGNEKKNNIKELLADRSEERRSSRAEKLLLYANSIDSSAALIIDKTSSIKETMIRNHNALKELWLQKRHLYRLKPLYLNLEHVKLYLPQNSEQKLADLKIELFNFRKSLIYNLATQETTDSTAPVFYFNDPDIRFFSDSEELMNEINSAISKSNVSLDDQETLRAVYKELTSFSARLPVKVSDPIDYLDMLLAVENVVLSARADVISIIRYRFTGIDCRMDTYYPIVECPSVCSVGDTIDIKALLGAYDSDEDLSVIFNSKPFETVKDGIAYQTLVIPNKKELVLNGTMIVRTKSGIPKVVPWQKKIKILPKKVKTTI